MPAETDGGRDVVEGREGASSVVRWGALALGGLLAALAAQPASAPSLCCAERVVNEAAASHVCGLPASSDGACMGAVVAAELQRRGLRGLFETEAALQAQRRKKVREEVAECLGLFEAALP